jgi:hypothetical protein
MTMRNVGPYLLAMGAAVALSAGLGYAQNNQHEHATPPAAQGGSADHQAMMAGMMVNMQAEQKKLDELVAQMNAAKGPDKVDRIAAVVTEMAAMHKRMSTMQGGRMQMMHGQAPAAPPKKSPDDHAEHH